MSDYWWEQRVQAEDFRVHQSHPQSERAYPDCHWCERWHPDNDVMPNRASMHDGTGEKDG